MNDDYVNVKLDLLDKTYKIDVIKIGQEYCRPDKKHESLVRDYHSIHFVLDGYGTIVVGQKKIMLGRGSVFVLYGGEHYDYYPDTVKPWSYIWANLQRGYDEQADNVLDLFAKCGFTKKKPYVIFNEYSQLANNFMQMFKYYDGTSLQSLRCSAYFSLIISQLISQKNKYAPVGEHGSLSYKYFTDIITYVNSNYRLNLSIGQIAADLNFSEKQVYAMFKKYIDMTPVDYINRYRISNACILFKQTDISVENVSLMVGIENPKYFTRLFGKWKGMSPREYKAVCDGDDPFYWMKEKNINYR